MILSIPGGAAGSPEVGDIWKLSDGRWLVFDHDSGLQFGWTYSDGTRAGAHYLAAFWEHLKEHDAKLLARDDGTWSWPANGRKGVGPSGNESIHWATNRLARLEAAPEEMLEELTP